MSTLAVIVGEDGNMRSRWVVAVVALLVVGGALEARGQEPQAGSEADVLRRLGTVEETVRRQAEVIADQARRIEELQSSGQQTSQALEKVEAAAKAPVKAEEMPAWLKGLKFAGDLQLRGESIDYDGDTRDVTHGRFRLRFGVEKQVTDEMLAGLRLASGSSSDPTSTNQSFTDDFSKKDVWIDLAYALYKPAAIKDLTVGGGKLKNPFISTDMVWDTDVNPEGAFANYAWQAADSLKPFVTAGGFLVDDNADTADANMAAAQAGWNWTVREGVVWTMAAAYYDWMNVEEPGNFYGGKARGNTASGGRLTAGDFDVLNFTNVVAFNACGRPVRVFADYAKNLGDEAPAPDSGEDTAYGAGVVVGGTKEKGDWQADYAWKRIEPNAVVGGFADATFGFADRKGHVLGLSYALHKNVVARIAGYFTEPVEGSEPETTTVQADLTFRM